MLKNFMIKSQQLLFNVANLLSFPFLLAPFCLGRLVLMFAQWVNNMFQPIPWEKQAFVFFLSFFLLFPFSFPFLPRTTWANCLYKESTIGLNSSLEKSKLLSIFFLSPFPFSPYARFCWGRLVLMFVQWVKDKKGLGAFLKQTEIERVTNDDNLFWNSPRPFSPLCVLQFNKKSSAVVSEILPETHFKATSYCELDSRD